MPWSASAWQQGLRVPPFIVRHRPRQHAFGLIIRMANDDIVQPVWAASAGFLHLSGGLPKQLSASEAGQVQWRQLVVLVLLPWTCNDSDGW